MRRHLCLWVCGLFLFCGTSRGADPETIQIGIVDSMVKSLSPTLQLFLSVEFNGLVKDFTGYKSRIVSEFDPLRIEKNVGNSQVHLVIYQGVDFAWAQSRDAQLMPLMVAAFKQPTLHAVLVTKKESSVANFQDLKGKDINILTKEHCRLFVEKSIQGKAKDYFGTSRTTYNLEAILDEVVLGKAQAAVVDNVTLDIYKNIHPGRFGRLQVVAQSESFPVPVVAYRQGTLSDSMLTRFREGMFKANQSDKGREAFAAFNIVGFENVPADYPQKLQETLKAYPVPE
jgi:ABC-type phosphate/phosphonate transport system substrate-binding protein